MSAGQACLPFLAPPDVVDDHGWREVEVDITRRVCPYGRNPAGGCGIAYWVDADGQWVQDCTMAGVGSECVWRHPERELPDLLEGQPEIANPLAVWPIPRPDGEHE